MADSGFKPDAETMAALAFLIPFAMAGRMPSPAEAEQMAARLDDARRRKVLGVVAHLCREAERIAGRGSSH